MKVLPIAFTMISKAKTEFWVQSMFNQVRLFYGKIIKSFMKSPLPSYRPTILRVAEPSWSF